MKKGNKAGHAEYDKANYGTWDKQAMTQIMK
jgi:hypothetical protein